MAYPSTDLRLSADTDEKVAVKKKKKEGRKKRKK